MSIKITEQNFETEVLQSAMPVVVDFWADWCGPCKMIAPILEQIAEEHPELTIAKMNIDDDPSVAISYGVTGIPTLLLFENGQVKQTVVGYREKADLEALLNLK